MKADDIRGQFLAFFEERGHRIVGSSSLIPPPETGLLLTTAGMVQFIPSFLGLQEAPYPRAATSQKSFRANDIENVGHTDRHLTFFEMLGNFSFGDYFKTEAIAFAHELVTSRYGIDHDRLWVTVFENDEEAVAAWVAVGVAPDRIVRRGKVDEHGEPANFWWTHKAGPCGPCSEIFVDRGPRHGPEGGPDVDEDRFCEIWNLVFMQDECDDDSNVLHPLPKQNIDTGSSLERVAMVLQDVNNVFETDLLRPLLSAAEDLTGRRYGEDASTDVSLRVMAEHGRATTFLIGDGVLPSNEGRGYVLRRELRRLITYARRLGVDHPVMGGLVERTVELMGEAYPELVENRAYILQVAGAEEERFLETFNLGMSRFEEGARATKQDAAAVFPGEAAFQLHDTYGFQIQLVQELAEAEGLTVDLDEFNRLMEQQRDRGRRHRASSGTDAEIVGPLNELAGSASPSESLAYEYLAAEGTLVGLIRGPEVVPLASEGDDVSVVLDRTPFYAEGGGQVGDRGIIRTATGMIAVRETHPSPAGFIVHNGTVTAGEVGQGQAVVSEVDAEARAATTRSHTATHVLHHTLRQVLGEHARQAGSLITPGHLRFDFTHFEALPVDRMEEIEAIANDRLRDDNPVRAYETTLEFARSQGAVALFGEKYGNLVRVVEIGDWSKELCGGTHVHHTGQIALLRLLHEASIGSGFRRIEALTGPDALRHVNAERRLLEELAGELGVTDPKQAPERVRRLLAEHKRLQGELAKIQRAAASGEVERLAALAEDVGGIQVVLQRMDGRPEGELRELAPRVAAAVGGRERPAAVVLATATEKGPRVVASVNEALLPTATARRLLEEVGPLIRGGVGGKDGLAFAGGSDAGGLAPALAAVRSRLAGLLGGG